MPSSRKTRNPRWTEKVALGILDQAVKNQWPHADAIKNEIARLDAKLKLKLSAKEKDMAKDERRVRLAQISLYAQEYYDKWSTETVKGNAKRFSQLFKAAQAQHPWYMSDSFNTWVKNMMASKFNVDQLARESKIRRKAGESDTVYLKRLFDGPQSVLRNNRSQMMFYEAYRTSKLMTPPITPKITAAVAVVPSAGVVSPVVPKPTPAVSVPTPAKVPSPPKKTVGKAAKPLPNVSDEIYRRIATNTEALGKNYYTFSRRMDQLVWVATWLIRNGSCVLKGVAGTGKTTLIETTTLLFCNDYDLNKFPKGSDVDYFEVKNGLVNMGILGEAKHNEDKKPDDVFFATEIRIEHRQRKGKPPKALVKNNPYPVGTREFLAQEKITTLMGEIKALGYSPLPDELEVIETRPRPREVVNAVVKFHNEANRMNNEVADTFLGVLAEGTVEFMGQAFSSPAPNMGRRKDQLNFLDYNPHLDVEGKEMDRALLDRLTTGIYLSGGDVGLRLTLLETANELVWNPNKEDPDSGSDGMWEKKRDIQQVAVDDIRADAISPISLSELRQLWGAIPLIPMDEECLAWISFFTFLPNMTVRTYDQYYGEVDWEKSKSFNVLKKTEPMINQYIDTSLQSYKQAGELLPVKTPSIQIFDLVDSFDRPLGVRSAKALVDLYRSYAFLREALAGKDPNKVNLEINGSDSKRRQVIGDLLQLLPYVLDHRVNLGVRETPMQRQFLNYFQFVENFFVPFALTELAKSDGWIKMMDISMFVHRRVRRGELSRSEAVAAYIDEYASVFGKNRTDAELEVTADPFKFAFARLW